MSPKPASVDAYIASFPADVQPLLEQARAAIHAAAPGLGETISYGLPTFTRDGRYVVYLAGWKRHLSVYPIPGDPELAPELAPYREAKGTLRFPLDRPIPFELIGRVAAALLHEREEGDGGRG